MELKPKEPTIPHDELRRALEQANRTTSELESQMVEIKGQLEKARNEARLLSELLSLRDEPPEGEVENPFNQPLRKSGTGASTMTSAVVDAAIDVLERNGSPMHIGELFEALQDEGVQIPGAGNQANLIFHLRRDVRIVRPKRGFYGLATWNISEYSPASTRPGKGRGK